MPELIRKVGGGGPVLREHLRTEKFVIHNLSGPASDKRGRPVSDRTLYWCTKTGRIKLPYSELLALGLNSREHLYG